MPSISWSTAKSSSRPDALAQLSPNRINSNRSHERLPYDIIDTIRLTEKATLLSEKYNQYVFRVAIHANKLQIKHAIESCSSKKGSARVNTCNYAGKKRRERTAAYGRKPNWKKAIVTLEEGDQDRAGLTRSPNSNPMALKTFRPLTPTNRFKALPAFEEITKSKPEKALLEVKKRSGGRNNNGRITTRHIGGGHKQKYRIIDFKRAKRGVEATVIGIEYDPNRTARIALLQYTDGEKTYILAPSGLNVGAKVVAGENVAPESAMQCR